MVDLPLPEALPRRLVNAVEDAWVEADEAGDDYWECAQKALLAVLTFRDESGHRAVWSAEEVADERVRLAEIANWHIDEVERQQARIEALEREVEPLIEALTVIRDESAVFSRDQAEDTLRAIRDTARAALDRVRGPESATKGEQS